MFSKKFILKFIFCFYLFIFLFTQLSFFSWLFGKKKVENEPEALKLTSIGDELDESNEYVQKWKRDVEPIILDRELEAINNRIAGVQEAKVMKTKRKVKLTPYIKDPSGKRKRRLPLVLKIPEKRASLDKKRTKIEQKLQELDNWQVRKPNVVTSSPITFGQSTPLSKDGFKKEEQKISATLTKGKKLPSFLLHNLIKKKPKPVEKSPEEIAADQKAIAEVHRIERKIEGDHILPRNDRIQVEEKLHKLNKEIRSK